MELESNLRENLRSHQLVASENYAQVCKKDEFPFQVFASKGNYLQEFHHLDHFHPVGSSSNPVIDNGYLCSFDPFNPYSYGCSSNNNVVAEDLYEYKACADQNGGCGQVMDNFQSGDCYNFHQRNNMDIMGLERNSIPSNFLDIKPVNFIVPDEVSCITSGNAHIQKAIMNKNATFPSLLRTTSKCRKKPTVIKGQWTVEEDRLLVQLVEQYGVRKWSHIAQMLPGRIGKQCRERWHNHLRPDIKKDTWSEEEDRVLIEAHSEIGNKWAEIAKRLPGRTENSIKNHWNATKRRQYSKRKCRSKYPRCSLLQDYIKSLNLDSNTARHQKKNSATSAVHNAKSKSADHHQAQITELCPNDWPVPNLDFKEDAEFYFDDNFFQEGCSINSLMEDIPCGSIDDANNYDRKRSNASVASVDYHQKSNVEMEKLQYYASYVIEGKFETDDREPVDAAAAAAAAAATMEFEVKKELDLVEMMTQVNEFK